MEIKHTFTIDKSKARCGGQLSKKFARGKGNTRLCNNEGFMCCLGQFGKSLGIPKQNLLEQGSPTSTIEKHSPFFSFTDSYLPFININDNIYITNPEREKQLKKAFRNIGVKVKFEGKYTKSSPTEKT